jgi:glutaredoxin
MEILMLVIYTRDNCPYCSKLKMVLDSFAVEYTPYNLGVDFDREQFYNEFGEGSTFPRVVLDGSVLGGCTETLEFLTSIGCLQEEKDMECMV